MLEAKKSKYKLDFFFTSFLKNTQHHIKNYFFEFLNFSVYVDNPHV